MGTIILFWNPAISSYNLMMHRDLLSKDFFEIGSFNWSVWDHQRAHEGDRFFMVRCKNKPVPGKLNKWGKHLMTQPVSVWQEYSYPSHTGF